MQNADDMRQTWVKTAFYLLTAQHKVFQNLVHESQKIYFTFERKIIFKQTASKQIQGIR